MHVKPAAVAEMAQPKSEAAKPAVGIHLRRRDIGDHVGGRLGVGGCGRWGGGIGDVSGGLGGARRFASPWVCVGNKESSSSVITAEQLKDGHGLCAGCSVLDGWWVTMQLGLARLPLPTPAPSCCAWISGRMAVALTATPCTG